jgi:hypothetical protein
MLYTSLHPLPSTAAAAASFSGEDAVATLLDALASATAALLRRVGSLTLLPLDGVAAMLKYMPSMCCDTVLSARCSSSVVGAESVDMKLRSIWCTWSLQK